MEAMNQNSSGWSRRDVLRMASIAGAGFAGIGSLSACGDDSGTQASNKGTGGGGVKQVSVILDWIPKGQTSPFFLALDKGFWADRGLAVQLQRGYGSGDTAVRVGRGEAAYGWAGVSAVMSAIAKGLPLIEVAATAHNHPTAVYAKPGTRLESAQDLTGLRGADNATGENNAIARAYLAANGMDYGKAVKWIYADDAGLPQVVGGQADFVMDWISNLPEWWLAEPPIEPSTLQIGRELGVYGNGIIANAEAAKKDPEALQALVAGVLQGYQYVLENGEKAQEESIAALFKYNPEVAEQPGAKDFHSANLKLFLALMLDDDTAQTGIGYFVPEKTEKSLGFINEYLLKEPIELKKAFDLDVVKKGAFPIKDMDAARASVSKVLGHDNPLMST
jgi:NitT/TauT family transport system substrate-binding protein